MRVTVWNEYRHEKRSADVQAVYPDGIHQAIAAPLREAGHEVRTAEQVLEEIGIDMNRFLSVAH